MSLWKKSTKPGAGVQRRTARAASSNQVFQPEKPRSGNSLTSGSEVITLVPGAAGLAASHASASAWMIVREGDESVTGSPIRDFGDLGFDGFPLGEPRLDLFADFEAFGFELLHVSGARAFEEAVFGIAVGDGLLARLCGFDLREQFVTSRGQGTQAIAALLLFFPRKTGRGRGRHALARVGVRLCFQAHGLAVEVIVARASEVLRVGARES